MVKTDIELREAIENYITQLEKEIDVHKIILYGSYAQGEANDWSDIDVSVISPDFNGMDRLERQKLLSQAHVNASPYLEPIGYDLEEYETAHPQTFLGEIKRTGIVVWDKGCGWIGLGERRTSVALPNRLLHIIDHLEEGHTTEDKLTRLVAREIATRLKACRHVDRAMRRKYGIDLEAFTRDGQSSKAVHADEAERDLQKWVEAFDTIKTLQRALEILRPE